MEEFEINIRTLRSQIINPSFLTDEEAKVKPHFSSNVVNRLENKDIVTYRLRDQTFIPHYALDLSISKYVFRDDDYEKEVEDIEYPKLLGISRNGTISNNINVILDMMFNYWTIDNHNSLFKVPFVKDGLQNHLFIAPGIILDKDGKILCSLVYKKELLIKMNQIKGRAKIRDFFSMYNKTIRADYGVTLDEFLNENAIFLFSREFTQKPEYSRFYKAILTIFVNGIKYNLDSMTTDSIEKHINNLPLDTTLDLNFKSLREKDNYCREVLQKAILT